MKRAVRAYRRDERKRLIIHVFAEQIRAGKHRFMTVAMLAKEMNIRPSTKLRKILREMVESELLLVTKVEDAGIAGFREIYELNYHKDSFETSHENRRAVRREHAIKLNTRTGSEMLVLR